MPRSEFYYAEMHSTRDDGDVDKLYDVDPRLFNFYLNNKYLLETKKRGKKSAHELKIMDILEKIEDFMDTLTYLDIEDDRKRINNETNDLHQRIDKLDVVYKKQPKKSAKTKRVVIKNKSPVDNLLNNLNKMPKYKPMSVEIKKHP